MANRFTNPLYSIITTTPSQKIDRDKAVTANIEHQLETAAVVISQSALSLYSWEDMIKVSDGIKITNSKNEGLESIWDPRMGCVTERDQCVHCGLFDCPGHYGLIEFRTYIYNPVFIRDVVSIIRCICKDCHKLLISEEVIVDKGLNKLGYQTRLRALEQECVKVTCLNCGGENPSYMAESTDPGMTIKGTVIKGGEGSRVFQTIGVDGDVLDEHEFTQDEFNMDASKEEQLKRNLTSLRRRGLGVKGVIRQKLYSKGNEPTDKNGKKLKDPGVIIPIDEIYRILDNISADDARLLGFSESVNQIIYRSCQAILTSVIYSAFPLHKAEMKRLKRFAVAGESLRDKLLAIIDDDGLVADIERDLMTKIYPQLTTVLNKLLNIITDDKGGISKLFDELKQQVNNSALIKVIDEYENNFDIDNFATFKGKLDPLLKKNKLRISLDDFEKKLQEELSDKQYNNLANILLGIANDNTIRVSKEAPRLTKKTVENLLNQLNPIIDQLFDKIYKQMLDFASLSEENVDNDQFNEVVALIFDIKSFGNNSAVEIKRKILKYNAMVKYSHPRDLIMQGMLVTPRVTRQPMYRNGTFYPDSLTTLYISLMRRLINFEKERSAVGNLLRRATSKSERAAIRARHLIDVNSAYNVAYFYFYVAIKNLIFGYKRNKNYFPPDPNKLDPLSIFERIQGKEALIRHSMMGKIVSYCGRTVAGPDAAVKFGQIRLPEAWKRALTKNITVTDFNQIALQQLLDTGKITHLTKLSTGIKKIYLLSAKYKLKIGDKVDRELQNGDRVIVNRQPTLHKQSMMKYEVVLAKQKTIGLHLSYTSPMNADFDGDEINAWDPQDFEVEAEADIIMDVKRNIMSAEQNRPIMGLVMNSISAAYLLSQTDVIIKEKLFVELLGLLSNFNLDDLKARLQKWGINPYSGAAIFSAMLPRNFYYRQKGILIIDGILISGRLKKSSVGASHRSIIQDLYSRFGVGATVDFFTAAPWILNKWVMERGFSVGLLDMINLAIDKNNQEYDKNLRVLKKELTNIYVQIEALGSSATDPLEEAFRIKQITNLSNIANGIGIRLADEVLGKNNSIGVMTEKGAGTKGAVANIGQMMGAVGQQFYQGKRLQPTIDHNSRLLPTFDPHDNNPEAHAFIPTSFFTGIDINGLFFLQAGGRENLLDTALKTQDTGSMSHKMIKAFENIVVAYDGSVRNSVGSLFMTCYNSGYDVGEMMMVDYPGKADFSSFIDIKSAIEELNVKRGWIPDNVSAIVENNKKKNNRINNKNLKDNPLIEEEIVEVPVVVKQLTRLEESRVIAARAQQLANNDIPLIDVEETTDMVTIAEEEFSAGLLDFIYIVRKYPDGTTVK